MKKTEVETKFELSATDFAQLLAAGRVARREEQLNVYYDTQWQLANKSATLRIRFHHGACPVMTLKTPISMIGQRRTMQEIDLPLSEHRQMLVRSPCPNDIDVEKDLTTELKDCLLGLGVHHVRRVGHVRNVRLVVHFGSAGSIELDQLKLPDGTVVHEAEIEADTAEVHERLSQVVRRYAPNAKPSTISKFQRFRMAADTAERKHDLATSRA